MPLVDNIKQLGGEIRGSTFVTDVKADQQRNRVTSVVTKSKDVGQEGDTHSAGGSLPYNHSPREPGSAHQVVSDDFRAREEAEAEAKNAAISRIAVCPITIHGSRIWC